MSTQTEIVPLVLIVSGPSGSGKSTLVQRILELPGTMPSISCTTRARRATEASGKCYDFVTEAEFDAMVARGEFLEYARVFGKHSYGTPLKWLEESRKKDSTLFLGSVSKERRKESKRFRKPARFLFCRRRAKTLDAGCANAARVRE